MQKENLFFFSFPSASTFGKAKGTNKRVKCKRNKEKTKPTPSKSPRGKTVFTPSLGRAGEGLDWISFGGPIRPVCRRKTLRLAPPSSAARISGAKIQHLSYPEKRCF
jgi:hypothetical protein